MELKHPLLGNFVSFVRSFAASDPYRTCSTVSTGGCCQQLASHRHKRVRRFSNASSRSSPLSPDLASPGRRCSFFRDKVTTVKRATGRFYPAAAICRLRIIRSSRFFNEISNAKPTSTGEQRAKKQFHRRRPCDTEENSLLLFHAFHPSPPSSPTLSLPFFLLSRLAISFAEGKHRLENTHLDKQLTRRLGKQRFIDRLRAANFGTAVAREVTDSPLFLVEIEEKEKRNFFSKGPNPG